MPINLIILSLLWFKWNRKKIWCRLTILCIFELKNKNASAGAYGNLQININDTSFAGTRKEQIYII